MLDSWCKKEGIAQICFNGWFSEFCQIMREETNGLKLRYSKDLNHKSVFKDKDASEVLSYFVFCPINKATNVAIISYLQTFLLEQHY